MPGLALKLEHPGPEIRNHAPHRAGTALSGPGLPAPGTATRSVPVSRGGAAEQSLKPPILPRDRGDVKLTPGAAETRRSEKEPDSGARREPPRPDLSGLAAGAGTGDWRGNARPPAALVITRRRNREEDRARPG
ncbi:hypothetical protein NDU88_004705 [Pleurodeles waltl]|uniref:Uncharacterized protein n=1 Tax=Pleurodeles waltl TaxID=8319 RepID=A0AAV7LJF4_PLEWA|nr:hypothetical protein NDU88_004705 [Pleurodeles waltl]